MRVSLWKAGDAVSIKINGTKHQEERRGRDPDSQNPVAAVRPEQQRSKGKTGGHDAHPRYQDVPDRQRDAERYTHEEFPRVNELISHLVESAPLSRTFNVDAFSSHKFLAGKKAA
jgi:hypothetical protein